MKNAELQDRSRDTGFGLIGVSAVFGCVAVVVLLCGSVVAGYPQNFLSAKLGAAVRSESKLTGPFQPNALLSDGPISKGQFAFAAVDQQRAFTVDLGRIRTFDRIQLGTGGRPRSVVIEASSKGIDGPFGKVCETREPVYFQILRLPLTTARWVRFDFGRSSDRTVVHRVRIFKGYEHPDLTEAVKLLGERIKSDKAGLKEFHLQVAAGDWSAACGRLRAYFASAHKPDSAPNPGCDLARAERIVAGELDYAGLSRSDPWPIDWAWMKTTDWYEHKNFLSRGSAVGVVTDACYHTGSALWAKRFGEVFYDWVNENPKPDIMSRADYPTWRTLDTAARLSWLVSRFAEVTAAKNVDDELWANYLYSIWEHADYLKNDDFSGGNWLATITSSVTHTAQEFREFGDRKIWLEYGKTGFERNVMRDIYPDGKEMEDAPGYICMAYKAMLATLGGLEEEGIAVDPDALGRLDKVQDFLAAVTQPNGIMPFIGDWGGCEPYALGAAMKRFDRDDIRYVLSKGQEGAEPAAASVNFPHGGWTIMRSAYADGPYEQARHLVFKSSSGAHGHRDVLAVTAYAFGRELLIDPGIRSYERADVERYVQTAYHNTVCIDGDSQPRRAGKTTKWFSNGGMDYVSGVLNGYHGLTHRRTILFVKPDYWFVRDYITGKGEHRYDQNWHFAADAGPSADAGTKRIRTNYEQGGNISIVAVNAGAFDCEPFDFFIAAKRMRSAKDNIPARGFRYSSSGPPPKTFDVLLYPYPSAEAPSIATEILAGERISGEMTGLKVAVGKNVDYIFIARDGPAEAVFDNGKIRINAEIVLVRTSGDNARLVAGNNVAKVVFAGETVFSRREPAVDVCVELE